MVKPGVQMNIRCDQPVGTVHADPTKLRQALFNLLSNACKFTERGALDLEVARAPLGGGGEEAITFRVRDTGIGMTLDEISRLFQPFSQGNSATARKYGGTGLGLVISRRFCQLMGGDITVASEPGKGSTFTLIIPTRVTPERRTGPSLPAPPPPPGAVAGTILVVDDDEPARALLRRFLEKQGYQVRTAADGEEALRLARELRPDLITLDVMMPRMDGWTVLSLLKHEAALADIPVLLLTIVDQKEHALAEGALDLLTKPIDRERLAAVVTKHARRASAARSLLVVDDDPAVRTLLRRMLEKQGWSVAEAEDGKSALDLITEHRPDLILLDLMMPTMDGFVFLDELARREGSNAAPVVVLTAKDLTDEDRHRLGRSVARVFEKTSLGGEGVVRAIGQVLAAAAEGGRS
jgi:CheY-like chemotaxis protein